MRDEPKICGVLHPVSGLRCGLYQGHRTAHRVLREDYPNDQTLKHLSQSEREFAVHRVRGSNPLLINGEKE